MWRNMYGFIQRPAATPQDGPHPHSCPLPIRDCRAPRARARQQAEHLAMEHAVPPSPEIVEEAGPVAGAKMQ